MGRRVDLPLIWPPSGSSGNGKAAGTQYLVQTPAGVLYAFQINVLGVSDLVFYKSTDGGVTWSTATIINSASINGFAVWYDKWSGLSSGLIHLAYIDATSSDTFYRTIDTESSDALSTQTTIFAGVSVADGGHLSVVRARGGNVLCKTVIDAGAEGGFFRLLNADVPNGAWALRTVDETIATQDKMILVPGFAADDQDIMAIFFDNSATELSRKIYDDSADSWAETSIATPITGGIATTAFPHLSACVDLANSRIIMVAWSAVDSANADLRCWTITESAITETSTNVVLNSTDDQGICGITLDLQTGDWLVFYGGKSDGSETFPTSMNVYMKISTDEGGTWSSEIKVSDSIGTVRQIVVPNRLYVGPFVLHWCREFAVALTTLFVFSVDRTVPRATSIAGIM